MTHIMGLEKWIPNPSPPKNYVHVLYKVCFFTGIFCFVCAVLFCLYLSSKVY